MFNNFDLKDEEIIKIIEDYNPLITRKSILGDKMDEDLSQEIKVAIFKELSKNRKK